MKLKDVPEALRGDLAGWRFIEVYRVKLPCEHGACCENQGFYVDRAEAIEQARWLFADRVPAEAEEDLFRLAIDPMVVLTQNGRDAIVLGIDGFRGRVQLIGDPSKPALRLV